MKTILLDLSESLSDSSSLRSSPAVSSTELLSGTGLFSSNWCANTMDKNNDPNLAPGAAAGKANRKGEVDREPSDDGKPGRPAIRVPKYSGQSSLSSFALQLDYNDRAYRLRSASGDRQKGPDSRPSGDFSGSIDCIWQSARHRGKRTPFIDELSQRLVRSEASMCNALRIWTAQRSLEL